MNPESANETLVMVTCQATQVAYDIIDSIRKNNASVNLENSFFSAVEFNITNPPTRWNSIGLKKLAMPAYGAVNDAVVRLFKDVPALTNILTSMNRDFYPPMLEFNNIGFKKLSESEALVNKFSNLGDEDAAKKLSEFLKATLSASVKKPSVEEWHKIMLSFGFPENYKDHLHFDEIGSYFSNKTDILNIIKEAKTSSGQLFNHSYTRWLGRIINPFMPNGAIADVVNTVFALMQEPIPPKVTDVYVASVINQFTDILVGRLPRKQFPNFGYHVQDCECDDMWSTSILKFLNPNLSVSMIFPTYMENIEKVHISDRKENVWIKTHKFQITEDNYLQYTVTKQFTTDELEQIKNKIFNENTFGPLFTLYFDKESANYPAVQLLWKSLGMPKP